jgi:hypothetical protein
MGVKEYKLRVAVGVFCTEGVPKRGWETKTHGTNIGDGGAETKSKQTVKHKQRGRGRRRRHRE